MGILNYVPERGDIVKLDLSPTRGHEQRGHRPMMVITLKKFNRASGRMLICPITRTIREDPFEVPIDTLEVRGVVLPDQIRTIDWNARKPKFVANSPQNVLDEVIRKIRLLID